jgi:hypothetical protein
VIHDTGAGSVLLPKDFTYLLNRNFGVVRESCDQTIGIIVLTQTAQITKKEDASQCLKCGDIFAGWYPVSFLLSLLSRCLLGQFFFKIADTRGISDYVLTVLPVRTGRIASFALDVLNSTSAHFSPEALVPVLAQFLRTDIHTSLALYLLLWQNKSLVRPNLLYLVPGTYVSRTYRTRVPKHALGISILPNICRLCVSIRPSLRVLTLRTYVIHVCHSLRFFIISGFLSHVT